MVRMLADYISKSWELHKQQWELFTEYWLVWLVLFSICMLAIYLVEKMWK